MRKTVAAILGTAALGQGLLLAYAASVFWIVNGIGQVDTADGGSPGPLDGYGVTGILFGLGIATSSAGIHVFWKDSRWRSASVAFIAAANAAFAAAAIGIVVIAEEPADRGVAVLIAVMAVGLSTVALRARRQLPRTS